MTRTAAPTLLVIAVVVAAAALLASCAAVPRESTHIVEVGGAKIHVERFGAGAPIVYLHGGLVFFDNNFGKQRDYFASFREVIGIDRRGHGHSPDDARPFSYREMAEETAAVIRALGLGAVDVVGHSDGGNIGLILAREHPELVRRLAISGANLRPGLPPDELQRRASWTSAQVSEKTRELEAHLPPAFRIDYGKVAPDGPAHWPVLLEKSYRMWLTPVVIEPAELKLIKAPVLVIAGDHDFTSIEATTEIYRALPRGQLLILPSTGHGTFGERPELVNLAIREFLERPDAK